MPVFSTSTAPTRVDALPPVKRFIRIVTREVQDKAFAKNDALSFEI